MNKRPLRIFEKRIIPYTINFFGKSCEYIAKLQHVDLRDLSGKHLLYVIDERKDNRYAFMVSSLLIITYSHSFSLSE